MAAIGAAPRLLFALIAALCALATSATAQSDFSQRIEQVLENTAAEEAAAEEAAPPHQTEAPPPTSSRSPVRCYIDEGLTDRLAESVRVACAEYQAKFYEGMRDLNQNDVDVFRTQGALTIVLTVLMGLLILAGIVFSGYQLVMSVRYGQQYAKSDDLQVKYKDLAIQSTAIGISLLIVSLAFFYLYLRYVYSIH